MQIARDVAGFTMGQADELRKVMGKKQKDKIPVYREKFIAGAAARQRYRRRARRGDLRLRRAVRRLRLQQVARRRVRLDRLSNRVSQGQPPAAVFRGADVVGARQDRQARRVHRRSQETGHRGAAARRQRVAGRFRGGRHPDSLRSRGGEGHRRGRGPRRSCRPANGRQSSADLFDCVQARRSAARSTAKSTKR